MPNARLILVIWSCMLSLASASEDLLSTEVAAILERRCVSCHQPPDAKGGLDLTMSAGLRSGGESGEVIVVGEADASPLIEYVSGAEPLMPKNGTPLSGEELRALRQWIDGGAPWPDGITLTDKRFAGGKWWSTEPLVRPTVPEADPTWVRTPIDAFIWAKQRELGLHPAAEADRRTLMRRLSYDLLGLPPTPEEIDAFVNDAAPDAYERLVDRLLASPHYGERWARHWLDVVHYGDTHGYDKDKTRPNAWPYRDYVIRAFNADKPYAQFVREQLAGDVLYPDSADGVIATGFIAAGPFDWVGQIEVSDELIDKQITRNLDRDDMVATAINTLVSTTAQCARCHDHKFDPIPQEEYYSLQAVFAGVDRADRPYPGDPLIESRRKELTAEERRLIAEQEALQAELAAQANPEPLRARQEQLTADLEKLRAELTALPSEPLVFAAATDFAPQGSFAPTKGKSRPIHVLSRGNERSPLHEASPGALSCVTALPSRFELPADANEGARRASLAEWIVDARNPLTWRSIVNRVWLYHFGRALVDTPNDFGRMGAQPTHPELLDWLAMEFRDHGQSMKALHKLIVTSAVYRQSSAHDEALAAIDAGNQYLWRMHRRRLEAEAVYDSALAVAGKLDATMYGPGFQAFAFRDDHSPEYKYQEHDPDDPKSQRRSIYRFIVRSVPDPFMETLDCADPSLLVEKRNETLTPLQVLAQLNNKFMVRMAEHIAARVTTSSPDLPTQLQAAFRLAIGRDPDATELAELVAYAEQHGLPNACRAILNLNEFMFVD